MNSSKLCFVLLVSFVLILTSCGGTRARDRDTVRSGLLQRETPQIAFLDVWGPPERTRTESPETEEKRLEFSRFGGFYGRSKTTYEVWEYPKRGVTLIFYDRKLTGWKTDKTTEELRTLEK